MTFTERLEKMIDESEEMLRQVHEAEQRIEENKKECDKLHADIESKMASLNAWLEEL